MADITGKHLRKQLKADLIGKDSYRGVTLTYAWLANQFGHIGLGFIPTIILHKILSKTETSVQVWSPVFIGLAWTAFETYNFLGPLLLNRQTKSKIMFIPGRSYVFQPAWGNVAFDTCTDVFFFWFGACFAGLLCCRSHPVQIALSVIIALLVYPSYYWYKTKMYVQVPGYPFQFRLSQWEFHNLGKQDKIVISEFLDNRKKGKHLFLFGPEMSGKTSLGVAIATEISIKQHMGLYTTATKLYSLFSQTDSEIIAKGSLWTWRTTSVLVIDDINPGDPIADIVKPSEFLHFLDNDLASENKAAFKKVNIIWVLGNMRYKKDKLEPWVAMLKSIGVDEASITSLDLSFAPHHH